ncbi:MAG: DUF2231 domain-containing protein [Lacunisphaera sp.]
MNLILDYFGRMHPLLLHFPIAVLWLGALAEATRVWREAPSTGRAVVWLMGIGALAALAAAGSGWLLAAHERVRSDQRETLELHRWLGLATAVAACLSWAAAASWRETPSLARRWLRRLCVMGTAALVTVASHLGATIVWGKDWFSLQS